MRFAVLVVVVLGAACASASDDRYVFSVEQALATSPRGADLADVVPGAWDQVCVFTFHTPPVQVDSAIGQGWRNAGDVSTPTLQEFALLAFVEERRVVERIRYPRTKGDFAGPGPAPWYCLARADAVFQQRSPIEGGPPWIGPVAR